MHAQLSSGDKEPNFDKSLYLRLYLMCTSLLLHNREGSCIWVYTGENLDLLHANKQGRDQCQSMEHQPGFIQAGMSKFKDFSRTSKSRSNSFQ